MNKLTRISATVASSLALVAGFSGMASAQSGSSISDSGRNSHNRISYSNHVRTTVTNRNDVHLTNNNPQTAYSGDANVNCNDDVNGVSTGAAWNDSQVQADVTLDNSGATSAALSGGQGGDDMSVPQASITDSGRDSNNQVSFRNNVSTTVTNDNTVRLTNNNSQQAYSGNANVNNNDDVRNVTTGDASNTSNATFSVNITN